MWDGKHKAITFSYDDGAIQDRKLVDMLNKYNLKGTFNLNSSHLGFGVNPSELKNLYQGHEVAGHTLTHPDFAKCSDEAIAWQVEHDRNTLSTLMDYNVEGFAYPYGAFDDRIVNVLQKKTGVRYARTVVSTYGFDMQDDLLRFKPTVFHCEIDKLFALAEQFVSLKTDKPQLFYIWGHSFEFDRENEPITWEKFEEFCKIISNKSDIFYGTNREILLDK